MAIDNGWTEALNEQNRESVYEQRRSATMSQRQALGGYEQLAGQADLQEQESHDAKSNAVAAMLKLAISRGGRVPQSVIGALNRDLGMDGKNRAIYGVGIGANGDFIIKQARKDANTGQVLSQDVTLSPMDQYRIMLSKPGIFSRSDVGNMATMLNRRFGFKESEIPLPDDTMWDGDAAQLPEEARVGTRTPEGAVRVRGSWLAGPGKRGGSSFSADGKGGFTRSAWDGNGNRIEENGGTRADEKGQWKQISVGADTSEEPKQRYDEDGNPVYTAPSRQVRRYENTKTGEVVSVRDGETPPWEKGAASEKAQIEKMKQDNLNQRQRERIESQQLMQQAESDQKNTELAEKEGQWAKEYELKIKKAKDENERKALESRNDEVKTYMQFMGKMAGVLGNPMVPTEVKSQFASLYDETSRKLEELMGNKADVKQGDNVLDVSQVKSKDELNKVLSEAPEGSAVTLGGKTKVKRNGKWIDAPAK